MLQRFYRWLLPIGVLDRAAWGEPRTYADAWWEMCQALERVKRRVWAPLHEALREAADRLGRRDP